MMELATRNSSRAACSSGSPLPISSRSSPRLRKVKNIAARMKSSQRGLSFHFLNQIKPTPLRQGDDNREAARRERIRPSRPHGTHRKGEFSQVPHRLYHLQHLVVSLKEEFDRANRRTRGLPRCPVKTIPLMKKAREAWACYPGRACTFTEACDAYRPLAEDQLFATPTSWPVIGFQRWGLSILEEIRPRRASLNFR